MLKTDSLIVTKYARNDRFMQNRAREMVVLLSKRVKTNSFRKKRAVFLAIMSLFFAQK